jgi:hypothetical protein
MLSHSCVISPRFKGALAHVAEGKYGRTFADLPPLEIEEGLLRALVRVGSGMDTPINTFNDSLGDNRRIPAGFTFLGQFIAHDTTRDPSLFHHARSSELRNFRAPRLDLEAVYGGGPVSNPYLFDKDDPDRFLLGHNEPGVAGDVPRNPQGLALIADSRNDVHTIISQLHLAFLRFHNAVVDNLRSGLGRGYRLFEEARRVCTWHYQWIVLHEFLPMTVGQQLVDQIRQEGHFVYGFEDQPFIPLEFAGPHDLSGSGWRTPDSISACGGLEPLLCYPQPSGAAGEPADCSQAPTPTVGPPGRDRRQDGSSRGTLTCLQGPPARVRLWVALGRGGGAEDGP